MTEPIFGDTTETFYSRRLSEIYRAADAQLDWPLKRWLNGILAQFQDVNTLIDRFQYVTLDAGGDAGDTSDLTDPTTADLLWLPWLAQLVGARHDPNLSEADQRSTILNAVTGLRRGSKLAIAAAARKHLTGTRAVTVYDHSTDSGTPGTAGEWDVLIVTVATETPVAGSVVIQDVVDAGQKPAGVKLWHRTYEAEWDTIESLRPSWDDWEAAPGWRGIEETGLS